MRRISIALIVLAALLQQAASAKEIAAAPTFTFRRGVTLNHWTSNPIKGWSYGDPTWFSKADADWIAAAGLDHVQLIVSARELARPDNSLNPEKLAVVDSGIEWLHAAGLGTVIGISQFPDSMKAADLPPDGRGKSALQMRADFMGLIAKHYANRGADLRFIVYDIDDESSAAMNVYFASALAAVRKTSRDRTVCLMTRGADRLAEVNVPKHDRNVCLALVMAADPQSAGEALDVFLWQHQFEKKLPPITFPGTIPPLATLVAESDRWAVPFSGVTLDEAYLDRKFSRINAWINSNHPGIELYVSHWRYVTGWPFDPATVKDEASIRNFGAAFSRTTAKNNIGWSVYDYNSGSCIRNPDGTKALILQALQLQ